MSDVYGFADPGGDEDDFAIILAKITRGKAVVFAAKTYQLTDWGNNYDNIIHDIQVISYEHNVRMWICEKNSLGGVIISNMRNLGIHVQALVTGTRDMRPETRFGSKAKDSTYDKDTAVEWLRKLNQAGIIRIAAGGDKYLQKIHTQTLAYGRTAKGKWAGLGEHDDLVSCLLLLVAWARTTLLRELGRIGDVKPVGSAPVGYDTSSPGQKQMSAIKAALKRRGVKYDRLDVK